MSADESYAPPGLSVLSLSNPGLTAGATSFRASGPFRREPILTSGIENAKLNCLWRETHAGSVFQPAAMCMDFTVVCRISSAEVTSAQSQLDISDDHNLNFSTRCAGMSRSSSNCSHLTVGGAFNRDGRIQRSADYRHGQRLYQHVRHCRQRTSLADDPY